jgi:hypothetical protein
LFSVTVQIETRIPAAAEAGMKAEAYGATKAAPFQTKFKLSQHNFSSFFSLS